MYPRPFDLMRLVCSLCQDLPLTRGLYLPGLAALIGYPVLSVLLGSGQGGQAFVTAFFCGFALQIVFGFEGLARRLLALCQSAALAGGVGLAIACLPLIVLLLADDPLWCQRMQSAVYLGLACVFVLDVIKGRVTIAASLWPDAGMRGHLSGLTRAMVLVSAAFVVLNETLIYSLDQSQWLIGWALLPLVSQMVLRATVLTVMHLDDNGQPV